MSVITSVTCTPNRVEIGVRTLMGLAGQSASRAELVAALSPRSLKPLDAEGTTIARGVLDESVKLGLLELEDAQYRVASSVAHLDSDQLRDWLRVRLTSLQLAEAAGQGSFARALAWFLMQDPAHPLSVGGPAASDSPRSRITRDFGPDTGAFELTNVARFQNFAYWARYLGYAWFLEVDGKTFYVPDPSSAIRRAIVTDLGVGQIEIRVFLAKLAEACPVLELGATRADVESLLPPQDQRTVEDDGLSGATSLALQSLVEDGLIEVQQLADSPAIVLNSMAGPQRVSHIKVSG